MIKPDRVIALRTDRTIFQYAGRCTKVYLHRDCTQVLREAGNLAAARKAAVRTPQLFEVKRIEGCWALTTEYVRGETLAQRMISREGDRAAVLAAMIKAQLEVQGADASFYRSLKDEFRSRIMRSMLGEDVKVFLMDRLTGLEGGSTLCHMDISPENLILPEGGTQGIVIVDWECSCRGSAEADAAASWLSLDLEYGRETAEEYLQLYCSAGSALRKDIVQWLPLVAAYRLSDSSRRERELLLDVISGTYKYGGSCSI